MDSFKHELALEIAKMYISLNSSKYNQSDYIIMCSDFFTKYMEALKTIEAMARK